MKIGFIGLGHMGSGMAANLVKAGHDVTVYNRTPGRSQALAAQGAKIADSIADACRAEAVMTMLADDAAVENVAFGAHGILASLPPHAVHVSSSTISVALSATLTSRHAGAGQRFIAAPVFGRPEAAAAGQLFVIAAGAASALESVAPLLAAIGQKTFTVSEVPRLANLVKLSGNFLIAAHQYIDILTSTLFNAPVYKTYGALIAEQKFEPAGFSAVLGHKDIGLVLSAADDLRVPMAFASVLRDRFLALLAQGGDKLDWSAIASRSAPDA